jgi:hypothetical protein
VFYHISARHADVYFNESGFRWSQRVVAGHALRRTRRGRQVVKPLWLRIAPALQLPTVFRSAVGRLRRTRAGGIDIQCAVALFGWLRRSVVSVQIGWQADRFARRYSLTTGT